MDVVTEVPPGLETLPRILRRNAREMGTRPAYREKEFGIWQEWTWAEAEREIEALALGMADLGLKPGERVAIIGRNRPYLYWSMVAAQMNGAIPVPLYQDSVAEEMAFVLDHAGVAMVVAGDQEQVDKVLAVQERVPSLREMIYVDPRGLRKYDHTHLHDFRAVQERGRKASPEIARAVAEREAAGSGEDTCVILYTSGTTGRPKGVVLSNRNVIVTAINSSRFDRLTADEDILAYLPMAWVGDFIFSIGQAYWCGFCVNCPENQDTVMSDMREIGPTYFFAPPRIFENLLTQVMIRMEDAGRFKKWLFDHFMAHARKVGPSVLDGRPVGLGDRLKHALGNLLVYGPLKDTLGFGRIRVGYTAGEAIGPEIFEFYRSLGINLKQLYGQTEACPYITQQPDGEVYPDTVGVPSPGVELRIDEKGEIHYRSPGTFVEYFRNPEATAKTKDPEGWVATGDAGFIDPATGHLRILDRAKDVGRLRSGALFAPKYVENKLKFYPNILEAVVFGADRDWCAAFINIDLGAVGNWAERNNIAYASYQELSQHPKVLDMIQSHVEEVNRSLAGDEMLAACQIRRFLVLHKELDADDGELTRTRKVRRRVIEEKYADLIRALYDGSKTVSTTTEVTYEDGSKGSISATLEIRDAAVVEPAQGPGGQKMAAQ